MNNNIPVLPVAGSTVLRALLAMLAFVTRWLNSRARARRHRREAATLAGLDRRMLADIGINRADLRDAFSQPFWDDPTALLRERVSERRTHRNVPPLLFPLLQLLVCSAMSNSGRCSGHFAEIASRSASSS